MAAFVGQSGGDENLMKLVAQVSGPALPLHHGMSAGKKRCDWIIISRELFDEFEQWFGECRICRRPVLPVVNRISLLPRSRFAFVSVAMSPGVDRCRGRKESCRAIHHPRVPSTVSIPGG